MTITKDKAFPWEKALLGFTALGITVIGAKLLFFNGNGNGNGNGKSRNGRGNGHNMMLPPPQMPDYGTMYDGGDMQQQQEQPIGGPTPDMIPPGAVPYFGQTQNQFPTNTGGGGGMTPEQLTSNTVRRPVLADTNHYDSSYDNGYSAPRQRGVRYA
jgi:hypothetical protein